MGTDESARIWWKHLTYLGKWVLTTSLATVHRYSMTLEYEKRDGDEPSNAAEVLAKMTGRPATEFAAGEYEYPPLHELEVVSTEDVEE